MQNLMITRTMFCPKCYANDRPTKGNQFVVWGGKKQCFHPKICHHDGYKGYTPHLITFNQPLMIKGGKIELTETCGVCESTYHYKAQHIFFAIIAGRKMYLSHKDFQALFMRWVRTGYEII